MCAAEIAQAMIHLFYGENITQAREQAHEFLDGFFAEHPDATLFEMDADSWGKERFDELVSSRALFGGASIVLLKSLFENEEAEEYVLKQLAEMKSSSNAFVILEGKLTKAISEKIAKKAESVSDSGGGKAAKKEAFNRFAITDALGRRSKKETWVILQKGLLGEIPAEELHGILFWQVKSMLLAASSKSAAEAGLNPFVYNKALSFSKNFTEEELKNFSSKLVTIYHESRRGGDELPIALEKFVLSI